jgi:hypothetical protein
MAFGSPADPQEAIADRLTQHYSQHVVPRFEWIDCNASPFREPILGLSMNSRLVTCALLALAAVDMVSRCEAKSAEALRHSQLRDTFQDEAVALLSCDMRRLNADPASFMANEQEHMSSMLATLFLLTNLALWADDEGTWMLHLRGAGALLEVWSPDMASDTHDRDACLAIIHWMCNLEAWASVTRWTTLVQINRPADSSGWSGSLASHYAGVAGIIAGMYRQQHRLGGSHSGHRIDEVLATLRTGQARIFPQVSGDEESEEVQSYSSLGYLHQLATTIYLYRACMATEAATSAVALPMERLIEGLGGLDDDRIQPHSLVWPTFIAGTESGGSVDTQRVVLLILERVLAFNQSRLRRLKAFLNELWTRYGGEGGNKWLVVAHDWEQQSKALLVY